LALLDEITVLDESIVASLMEALNGLIDVTKLARDAAQYSTDIPKEYEEYLDLLENLFGLGFGSIIFPSPILVKSQLDYGYNNQVVVRTDKCRTSDGYTNNRRIVFQRRTDCGDWVFFDSIMMINILGGIRIKEKYKERARISK